MQGNAFKTILEQLEAKGDPLSDFNPADSLSRFEAMAASVFGSKNSNTAGNDNLWTAAVGAYVDDDYIDFDDDSAEDDIIGDGDVSDGNVSDKHVSDSPPVYSQAKHPLTLAQLREKLGADLSVDELGRLRRKFAFEHHPDRLPATERHTATSKLAIANDLIDHAIQNTGHNLAVR